MNSYPEFIILPLVQTKEDGSPIDLEQIRQIAKKGLKNCNPEDRLLCWLVLSGVFPEKAEDWDDAITSAMTNYRGFVKHFKIEGYEEKIFANNTMVTDFGVEDNKLMELIHNDIIRTGHHILYFPNKDEKIANPEDDILIPFHYHMRRLERILYIFSKCNPSTSYIQGLNEIVAVIYNVVAEGILIFNNNWLKAEAFSFYLFQNVFAETKLHEFYTVTDHSSIIFKRLNLFMELLSEHLPKLSLLVNKLGIHPLQFGFKRLTLIFSQDFEIPNLVLLWDSLFAHFNEFIEYENYLLISYLSIIEELLCNKDYSQTVEILQKLKICDSLKIVEKANVFWEEKHKN